MTVKSLIFIQLKLFMAHFIRNKIFYTSTKKIDTKMFQMNKSKEMSLKKKIIGSDWHRLLRLTPFQKHHWNLFINRIQNCLAWLNPINKSVSMMFLKWGQSDQSVAIGSSYFFLQGWLLKGFPIGVIWFWMSLSGSFELKFLTSAVSCDQ